MSSAINREIGLGADQVPRGVVIVVIVMGGSWDGSALRGDVPRDPPVLGSRGLGDGGNRAAPLELPEKRP